MSVALIAVAIASAFVFGAKATEAGESWDGFGGGMGRRSYVNITLPRRPTITLLWNTTATPFGPVSPASPVVTAGGILYTYLPTGPNTCTLSAINATTGAVITSIASWRDLDTSCASPTLANGGASVVVQTTQFGTSTAASYFTGGGGNQPYSQSWSLTVPAGQDVPFGVAAHGARIVTLGTLDHPAGTTFVDVKIEAQSWTRRALGGNVTMWSPSLLGGGDAPLSLFYNATPGSPLRIGASNATGGVAWSVAAEGTSVAGALYSYPVAAGANTVLGSAPRFDQEPGNNGTVVDFVAVEAGAGAKLRWSVHGKVPRPWSVPVASEGVNAFFACNDSLAVVDLVTGASRGALPCPGCLNPPLIIWSHVIAMATDGCVLGFYRWDLSAAPFRVCVPTDAGVPASMAIAGGSLFVTTDANAVFAYRLG